MQNRFIKIAAGLVCAAVLVIPLATHAAVYESAATNARFNNPWSTGVGTYNGTLYFSVSAPNLTKHIFQEKDSGAPEILDTINDPSNRRYIYVSVRMDQNAANDSSSGPFTTKIFRYDLDTGKIVRIYRAAGGSGYLFLGFDGNKLILLDAAYGDNSPGPGWLDEELAKPTLTYISVANPAKGVSTYKPGAKFHAMKVAVANSNLSF